MTPVNPGTVALGVYLLCLLLFNARIAPRGANSNRRLPAPPSIEVSLCVELHVPARSPSSSATSASGLSVGVGTTGAGVAMGGSGVGV